mmetsp:Transcript_70348/g.113419  ORF Transcript_70348/g.113419 Transcript_70348/m.113419 type:complete len:264 (-) Transcript_70348:534-1325(-)
MPCLAALLAAEPATSALRHAGSSLTPPTLRSKGALLAGVVVDAAATEMVTGDPAVSVASATAGWLLEPPAAESASLEAGEAFASSLSTCGDASPMSFLVSGPGLSGISDKGAALPFPDGLAAAFSGLFFSLASLDFAFALALGAPDHAGCPGTNSAALFLSTLLPAPCTGIGEPKTGAPVQAICPGTNSTAVGLNGALGAVLPAAPDQTLPGTNSAASCRKLFVSVELEAALAALAVGAVQALPGTNSTAPWLNDLSLASPAA